MCKCVVIAEICGHGEKNVHSFFSLQVITLKMKIKQQYSAIFFLIFFIDIG
jgi:hypothetical protein